MRITIRVTGKLWLGAVLLCISLVTSSGFAQDTIVKRDDARVLAKIIEVHDTEIHYKKFSNIEGPTYIIETNRIRQVIYSNGDVENYSQSQEAVAEVGQTWKTHQEYAIQHSEQIEYLDGRYYYNKRRLGENPIGNLIYKQGNHEAIKMWNSSRKSTKIAWILGFGSIPVGFASYAGFFSFEPAVIVGVGVGGFVAFNGMQLGKHILRAMSKNQKRKAVELYNAALTESLHDGEDYY